MESKSADRQEYEPEYSVYFRWWQDASHVGMEHATVAGKQGKDDNNIGSIITMLITDQVVAINNILSDTFSVAKMHFRAWIRESTKLFGGIQNFKLA